MGLQTGAFKRLQEQGQEWVGGATIDHIFLALGDLLQVAVERCLLQNASIATLTPKWPVQLTSCRWGTSQLDTFDCDGVCGQRTAPAVHSKAVKFVVPCH